MKLLVDAGFPQRIDRLPNAEGVDVHRLAAAMSDRQLVEHAGVEGYHAIVFLDAEMVSRPEIRVLARQAQVSLVCSTSDDPHEAEVNLRQWIGGIRASVTRHPGDLFWLRRDGVRREADSHDELG